MKKAIYIISALLIAFAGVCSAQVAGMSDVAFHDLGRDTTRINDLLIEVSAMNPASPNASVSLLADKFLGTPYVAHTLEGDEELLRVNLDELDCTTFVETVAAMAMTINERRSSWRDFVYNLRRIRYRNGIVDGYPSRLHYNSDWVVNNSYRGILKDVTDRFPSVSYIVKTIDFMSHHRDNYQSLKSDTVYQKIKEIESAYANHRFPYIKARDLGKKEVKAAFKDGDIVGLTTTIPGLDTSHMGIIRVKEGVPYLLHASMSGGKVMLSDLPLDEMFKRNRQWTGIRVLRLCE